MGGICLAAWSFQDLLRFLVRGGIEGHQAILTFIFLGAAFSAKLVGGAAGEALAFGAFPDGLDIGQTATLWAKLGYCKAGKGQEKSDEGKQWKLVHRATGFSWLCGLCRDAIGLLVGAMIMPY